MGTKTSFIFAVETFDFGVLRRIMAGLTPEIHRMLGALKSASVHDITTDAIREISLGSMPSDDIPLFSENEIVTLYSGSMQDGCVMLTFEGRFMVISIVLHRVSSAIDLLTECWRRIGGELNAALMGEELEVDERELDYLVREARIPEEADLCEAAIVRAPRENTRSIRGMRVEHEGVLLRS